MRNLLTDLWPRLRASLYSLWLKTRLLAITSWSRALAMIAGVRIFIPIAAVALLLAGYTWWWQQIASGIRVGAAQFQADQRALQRETAWDSLEISGFPYRVEALITGPKITAPDRGIAWDGKAVVLHMQPLNPRHVSLSFQGRQHVFYAKDGRLIEGGADANKAMLNVMAGSNGAEQIALEVEGLSAQGEWVGRHIEIVVPSASASADVAESDPDATTAPITVSATLSNVALRGDLTLPFGPIISLVEVKAHLRYPSLTPEGTSPSLVSAWRTTDTPIVVEGFKLDWGGVTLDARGEIKLDTQTRPEGRLHLKIGNHRRLLEVLTAEGWVSPEALPNINAALNTLAFVSGDPERRIDVTVSFAEGSAYLELFGLLPIKIGPVQPLFPPPALALPG